MLRFTANVLMSLTAIGLFLLLGNQVAIMTTMRSDFVVLVPIIIFAAAMVLVVILKSIWQKEINACIEFFKQ